jgi:zinc transporter 5/7
MFTAFNVFQESVERIFQPQLIDTTGALLPVSFIGLLVNVIGLIFFHDADPHHHHHEKSQA